MKRLVALIVMLGLVIFCGAGLAAEPMTYEIADAHIHYTDWVQGTEGVDSYIECMDAAKVTDSVFWGIPLSKMWRTEEGIDRETVRKLDISPRYWDKETDFVVAYAYTHAKPEQQKRLHPFLCGINGQDKTSLEHVRRMIQMYPGMWKGIGEIFSYHDFASWLTYGDIPHPDAAGYDLVYKFAAKYKMPVVIHSNMTAARATEPLYLAQMENAIRSNPGTTFVWAHVGVSNLLIIKDLPAIADRLLAQYSNLDFDISWLVYDDYIAKNGRLDPAWVALIKKYPDRFMIGSDLVGHFKPVENYKGEIRKYDLLLNSLPVDIAKKLAKDNFMKLLPAQGISLLSEDRITI